MSIFRGIEALDYYTLGIGESRKALAVAAQAQDSLGAAQASIELAKGSADGTNYAIVGAQKALSFLPANIDPNITHFVRGAALSQILGGLGVVTSSLGIIIEAIGFVRTEEVFQAVADLPTGTSTKTDQAKLKRALRNLQGLNYSRFLKSLPDDLRAQIEEKGGAKIFERMVDTVAQNQSIFAQNLLQDIQTGVTKKQVVHAVNIVACVFAFLASVAMILSCPLIGILCLTVVGLAFTALSALLKKGWVENPKEGFNWKLCLPEFLQKKLRVDKEIEFEMQNADSFISTHRT